LSRTHVSFLLLYCRTTERVVTHGESYSSKGVPHKSEFNFYSEDEHSDFDKWAHKKPEHHEEDEEEEKPDDFRVWVDDTSKSDHQEETKKRVQIKKRIPTRIKFHRKGEEEKVHTRQFDKQGPNLALGGSGKAEESRVKQPMVIRVLSPTPSKQPQGSLEDSWPSVWRGAH
jgi:hypothetical protein